MAPLKISSATAPKILSTRTCRGSACTLTASGFPERPSVAFGCLRKSPVKILSSTQLFLMGKCPAISPLHCEPRRYVLFSGCFAAPQNLDASSGFVLGYWLVVAFWGSDCDRLPRNLMMRTIVLAVCSMVIMTWRRYAGVANHPAARQYTVCRHAFRQMMTAEQNSLRASQAASPLTLRNSRNADPGTLNYYITIEVSLRCIGSILDATRARLSCA